MTERNWDSFAKKFKSFSFLFTIIMCSIKPKIGVMLFTIDNVKLVEMSNEFSTWAIKCFVTILKRSNQPKVVSKEELISYKS